MRGAHLVSLRLFLALGIALAVLAASAAANWGAPLTLSKGGQDALESDVALDANGNAVVVWERFDGTNSRIQVRELVGGVPGPVHNVSRAGQDAFEPQVAVNADGHAVIAWSRFDGANNRIQARELDAGVLGPVHNVSKGGLDAFEPLVAVDGGGNAVIAWTGSDGTNIRVRARVLGGGALGPIQNVSKAGQDAEETQVEVNADGHAIIAWERSDGTNSRIQARELDTDTEVLGPVRDFSNAGEDAFDPAVAIDAGANAIVVWHRSDGTTFRIQARELVSGALGPIHNVSKAEEVGLFEIEAVVGASATGNAVIAWNRFDGANIRIQARELAAGVLGAIQNVSKAGQDAEDPELAVGAGGKAVFAWGQSDGANDRIQARTRSANGNLGAVREVSKAGQDASDPHVAVNADGDAVLTWERSDGTNIRVQAALGP